MNFFTEDNGIKGKATDNDDVNEDVDQYHSKDSMTTE